MKKLLFLGGITLAVVIAQEPKDVLIEKEFEIRVAGPAEGAPAGKVIMYDSTAGLPAGGSVQWISAEFAGTPGGVKGAPYSTEIVNESVQTLGDGNRISNRNVTGFFRDSEGRTRHEMSGNFVKPDGSREEHKTIVIDDPVAGVHYSLDPQQKTARKLSVRAAVQPGGSGATLTPMPAPGRALVERQIAVARKGQVGAAIPAGAVNTPMVHFERIEAIGAGVPGGTGQVEPLGQQAIDGIQAKGTRSTFTIPAGQIGNERPIVTTSETWFSDELKAVVLSKRSDPRMGDSSTRMTNTRRGDQPRYLFEVPADYTIQEGLPEAIRLQRTLERNPEE